MGSAGEGWGEGAKKRGVAAVEWLSGLRLFLPPLPRIPPKWSFDGIWGRGLG
ncbi:hypothetical protein K227x_34400 [Rubripirellula lacrimiformis]|uniref:Uncharacterized protein n=1 Tax=Rubripirellula lacrimiformis TaxID=1930273 RepID=A0A517ND30_9BACT|nr:hypothetical protein K227x_34400 [Rubripirellula lacrimiformis]